MDAVSLSFTILDLPLFDSTFPQHGTHTRNRGFVPEPPRKDQAFLIDIVAASPSFVVTYLSPPNPRKQTVSARAHDFSIHSRLYAPLPEFLWIEACPGSEDTFVEIRAAVNGVNHVFF